jgi:hypothetical protein
MIFVYEAVSYYGYKLALNSLGVGKVTQWQTFAT